MELWAGRTVEFCAGRAVGVLCTGRVWLFCTGRVVVALCTGRFTVPCAGRAVGVLCVGRVVVALCVGRVLTAGLTVDEVETCLPLKREEILSIMAEGRELSVVWVVEFVLMALS